MLEIEIKELVISNELKKKIEMICKFCNMKPTFINGSIRNIKGINIAYLEPHQVIIDNNIYLLFEEYDYIFIGNLNKKMKLSKFKEFLKKTNLTK